VGHRRVPTAASQGEGREIHSRQNPTSRAVGGSYGARVPGTDPAPRPVRADELDLVVTLLAAEQADPTRAVPSVGTEPEGIRAELDDLDPPWTETARVVDDADEHPAGVAAIEWDASLARAWVLGPWVAGDDARWARCARRLLDAVVEQLPSGLTDVELSGSGDNRRIASLAEDLGWPAGPLNHALVVERATADRWSSTEAGIRPAERADLEGIARLHASEFPDTYLSATQLLDEATSGQRIVLVATDSGDSDREAVAGYATGHVLPDGEAFLDFVAVGPGHRRSGTGRDLVVTITQHLLALAPTGRLCLTVQDHREAARALYATLGFRHDATLLGYRRR
jgi:ribosomal protein S18 acetylase RimI-like enzyme